LPKTTQRGWQSEKKKSADTGRWQVSSGSAENQLFLTSLHISFNTLIGECMKQTLADVTRAHSQPKQAAVASGWPRALTATIFLQW
jgi:hypothetical protein